MDNNKDFEELLKSSLKPNIEANEKLNQDLKRTLRIEQAKPSTFSLWWLPLVLSTLFTVSLCLPVLYIGTATILQFLMIALSAVSTLSTLLLTLISFIKFNLKEGASL